MKFLEIANGKITVRISEVTGIEKIEEFSTRIYCGNYSFISDLPYQTLVDYIMSEEPEEESTLLQSIAENVEKIYNVASVQGSFAG